MKHMLKAYYIYMSVQLLLLLLLACWIGHFLLNHASSFAYHPSYFIAMGEVVHTHRVLLAFAGLDQSVSVFMTREVGGQLIACLSVGSSSL